MTNGHVYGVEIFMILLHKIIYFFYFFSRLVTCWNSRFSDLELVLKAEKVLKLCTFNRHNYANFIGVFINL